MRVTTALLVGLSIREGLSFWTGHLDFELWVRLGYYVAQGLDPYGSTLPVPDLSTYGFGVLPTIAYPPVWALMQGAVYELYRATAVDSRFLYYFLLKQETILPDIGAGYLLMRLLRQWGRAAEGEGAFAFWMVSPFVIVISALWGMFDQLVLMFVLFAILISGRRLLGPLSQGVAIVLKLVPVIFLPALAWGEGSARTRVGYLMFAGGAAAAIAVLPYLYYTNWSFFSLFKVESFTLNRVSNSVNYAVVLFVLNSYYGIPASAFPLLGAFGYLWIPAVVLAYYAALRGASSRGLTPRRAVLTLELVTLVFFLTRLSLPEEYVVYLIAFGLLSGRVLGVGRSAFRGMWISATVFLFSDNTYLVRFLAPVWSGAEGLDRALGAGALGYLRYGVMVASAVAFTFCCLMYLRVVYKELQGEKASSSAVEAGPGSGGLAKAEVQDKRIPGQVHEEDGEDAKVSIPQSRGQRGQGDSYRSCLQ